MYGENQQGSEAIRVGVIDCGTQSIVLLIAQKSTTGEQTFLHQEALDVSLWKYFDPATGNLSIEAVHTICSSIDRLYLVAQKFNVAECWVIATHAIRQAHNKYQILAAIKKIGLTVRLIHPLQEAKLSYGGAVLGLSSQRLVTVFDLGAGSLEVASCIREQRSKKLISKSLPLGAASVYQKGLFEKATLEDKQKVVCWMTDEISQLPHFEYPVIGTGGTLFAISQVIERLNDPKKEPVLHGVTLFLKDIERLISKIEQEGISNLPLGCNMSLDRKKLLYAGAWVIKLFMEKQAISFITISCYGLRHGFAKKRLDILSGTFKRRRVRHHANPMSTALMNIQTKMFNHSFAALEIELGCADAKFSFERARKNTQVMCVGLEIRREMVDRVNRQASKEGLQNLCAIFCNINSDIDKMFAPSSVDKVHVLFPDPWFKKDQHKRRLIQPSLANQLIDILKKNGVLFFQSDIYELALDAMAVFEVLPNLKNVYGEWSFAKTNPFDATSLRETRVLEKGDRVWRILYKKVIG